MKERNRRQEEEIRRGESVSVKVSEDECEEL
jgi:hypothetical protein